MTSMGMVIALLIATDKQGLRSQSMATAAMNFPIHSALRSHCNRAEISAIIRSATILLPAPPTWDQS
jgi:hypothetical protein